MDGTKTAKCDRCDVTDTVADPDSALGHSFTNYVSDGNATCTEDGTKTAKCDRCEVTDTVTDTGSTLGHSYSTEWSQGEETHWHECGNCGDRKDEAPHDYGDGDVCVECGYERSHVHRLTLVIAADPTCTEAGHTAYYTCSGCAEWFADASGAVVITDKTTVVIDALGHSFTNYVSDGNATCTEDGTKTAKCDRCDVTDTVTDTGSAMGHADVDADEHCDVCGTEMDGSSVIPPTGDSAYMVMTFLLMLISASGISVVALLRKKRGSAQ